MWRALALAAFIAAAVSSHPVSNSKSHAKVYNNGEESNLDDETNHIRQKRNVQSVNTVNKIAFESDEEQSAEDGAIRQKRDVQEVEGEAEQTDCEQSAEDGAVRQKRDVQEVDGEAVQTDEEQIAGDGAIRQKRDAQEVEGVDEQTDELQEAWADGNHAWQGDEGQFVVASDFGGPIVQILQRVFKTGNCCACGCDCGCPEEGEDASEE